ncbi:MAG: helix-turn-helix transcriptional regulator [Lachnospiraceae bacterium]|nr:helix-turn-helix transcriptional regulator [Lachnospiraceae bacterium]
MTQKDLGLRLKLLRLDHKLTQTKLADMLSISRSAYVNYETGRTTPSIDTLIGLSSIYNINLLEEFNFNSQIRFSDCKKAMSNLDRQELFSLLEAYSELSQNSREKIIALVKVLPKGGDI